MAYYAVQSDLRSEEILGLAEAYFGPGGLGLDAARPNPHHLYLAGEEGHVSVMAGPGGMKTAVDVETRALDPQVREFLRQIAG